MDRRPRLKIINKAGQWWCTSLIPALGRQRQEKLCEFKTSLVYKVSFRTGSKATEKPCLEKPNQIKTTTTTTTTNTKQNKKQKAKERESSCLSQIPLQFWGAHQRPLSRSLKLIESLFASRLGLYPGIRGPRCGPECP